MNTVTMKWLLRREFWEYKGSMFWAPLAVAAILVVFIGGTVAYGLSMHHIPTHIVINGQTIDHPGYSVGMTLELRNRFAQIASSVYLGTALPLFALLTAVIFSYCLGTLHDERRDRSILFWKSLPVSDGMTVLSKAVTAMVVAPLITIVVGTIASLLLLFIGCAALGVNGINMFGPLLVSPELYLSPLRLLALLPVYVVWALPAVGWLLLVSSWARAKPLVWAVGVPLVGLLIVKWISLAAANTGGEPLGLMPYAQEAVARLLGGIVPGIWFTFDGGVPPGLRTGASSVDVGSLVTASYATLADAATWLWALAGAAMLYAAMRLRRFRDEG
jgi:ABC-2 type transport system permease protein